MRWKGCCFVLAGVCLLLLPGCYKRYSLEKDLGPLQEKKVVAFEVRDVETGSEEVVRIEDEKIIKKLLEVAARPIRQVVQLSSWGVITFFFEDGSKAAGTFNYDADEKVIYIASWVFDDPELWNLLKEPLKLPDKTRGVPGPVIGPPPGAK